jgi:hypothetical protein
MEKENEISLMGEIKLYSRTEKERKEARILERKSYKGLAGPISPLVKV